MRAGVHRSTVQSIEEGRTREPDRERVEALAAALSCDPDDLAELLAEWAARHVDARADVPEERLVVLGYSPEQVAIAFSSFGHWRSQLSSSVTEFSGLLGVNRKVIADYEAGRTARMQVSLGHAILTRLGVSEAYLAAVMSLPTRGVDA